MKSASMARKVVDLEDALDDSSDNERVVLLSHNIVVLGNAAEGSLLQGRLQRHKMSLVLEAVDQDVKHMQPLISSVPKHVLQAGEHLHRVSPSLSTSHKQVHLVPHPGAQSVVCNPIRAQQWPSAEVA